MKIKHVEEKTMSIKQASNQSIKVKRQSIKQMTTVGAKTIADQMEGGEELINAGMLAYLTSKPVTEVTRKSVIHTRRSIQERNDKRLKRKEKRVSKEQNDRKQSSENSTSEKGKKKSEQGKTRDEKKSNRKTGIRRLINKAQMVLLMKPDIGRDEENRASRWETLLVQKIAVPLLAFFALGMLMCALVAIPVLALVAVIYNSPFAIFFPPLESGDTVQSVTSAYVAEFYQEVNELANIHEGYDAGRIVYVDYEGTNESPSNYYDILAVYMVKHGVGDTAIILNDTSREWISMVVDDMCDYTTSSGTEIVQNEDGTEHAQSVLYVNVILYDYRDMIAFYGFNDVETQLLEMLMSPDSLARLGYSMPDGTGRSSISQAEISEILRGVSDEKQKRACSYALNKVGYPYSQAYRDSGDYYDCSSLVYYAWLSADVNISYGGSNTAAAEAQGLEEAGCEIFYEELQPGDLIFWSFCHNGRYKNISHVAIYIGNGKVVEAKNESAGVVYGDLTNTEHIVLIGRPQ